MHIVTDNSTETKLLNAARALFWKHGIRRVSVEELCKESGVSKMTFYRYYKNKDEIALALLDKISLQAMEDYRKLMHSDKSFQEKVTEIVLMKESNTNGMSDEFISDILENDRSALQQRLNEHQQVMLGQVMQDFAAAQAKGEIRKDLRLEFILYQMNDMRTKLTDKNLRALYETEQELIMELTRFFFYGVLP